MSQRNYTLIGSLSQLLRARDWKMAVAESCTGGLIAASLTDLPGSSQWFCGGIVAYSNEVKTKILGVSQATIEEQGAVSVQTVEAMARKSREIFHCELALAVSGVAGPKGGSPEKPVGTVCIAWVLGENVESKRYQFKGNRQEVREKSVDFAIGGALDLLKLQ